MPIDSTGRWYPRLSQRQLEVYNDPRKILLLSGPRVCGKSIVAVHKIIKHAWLHANDRIGVFVKSTKVGRTGVWDDIISFGLPEWEEGLADAGFKVISTGVDGATRMGYCRIANRHGGVSEIQLHPLHHEDSVADKLKGSRFGCIFFDELDAHNSPDVFNVSLLQLRQIGLPEDKHLWIATTNPAGDTNHWIFTKFFSEPNDESFDKSYRDSFGVYQFKLSDNPFLHPDTITKLKMAYKNDDAMFKRYVEGLWVPDIKSVYFADCFRESFHVRGNLMEGTGILPTDGCTDIVVGYDLGDRNHAVVFLEHVQTTNGDYWAVLDYVSHLREDIAIEDVTYEVLEKMDDLERLAGKKLRFMHWSDRSAMDRYRSAADAYDHLLVSRYSKGRINLTGCPKPPGSVKMRINLVRQLLIEKRLFISADCVPIVNMMKRLAKGKTKGEPIKRDENIHLFDALTYALFGESIGELEDSLRPSLGQKVEPFSLA